MDPWAKIQVTLKAVLSSKHLQSVWARFVKHVSKHVDVQKFENGVFHRVAIVQDHLACFVGWACALPLQEVSWRLMKYYIDNDSLLLVSEMCFITGWMHSFFRGHLPDAVDSAMYSAAMSPLPSAPVPRRYADLRCPGIETGRPGCTVGAHSQSHHGDLLRVPWGESVLEVPCLAIFVAHSFNLGFLKTIQSRSWFHIGLLFLAIESSSQVDL